MSPLKTFCVEIFINNVFVVTHMRPPGLQYLVIMNVLFQTEHEYDTKLTEQRQKQQELIGQLKSQLEDLETYAYEVLTNTSNRRLVCLFMLRFCWSVIT